MDRKKNVCIRTWVDRGKRWTRMKLLYSTCTLPLNFFNILANRSESWNLPWANCISVADPTTFVRIRIKLLNWLGPDPVPDPDPSLYKMCTQNFQQEIFALKR
jgi:hypothetical protein